MSNITTKIWVTFAKKGFHMYPTAPTEVAYLALRHRHLFRYKVTAQVFHNEREIEFHMLQTELEDLYDTAVLECDGKSCETLAMDLMLYLQSNYPDRMFEVEVSEDGECGSVISTF